MLKGSKSVSMSYQSMIGDKVAVYMTASIPESGKSTSNKTIQDLDLYEANKTECRADMGEFEEMLWELEDQSADQKESASDSDGNEEETEVTES